MRSARSSGDRVVRVGRRGGQHRRPPAHGSKPNICSIANDSTGVRILRSRCDSSAVAIRRGPNAAKVMLLTDARVVTPAGVLEPGWVRIEARSHPRCRFGAGTLRRGRAPRARWTVGGAGVHRPARPRRRRPRDAVGGSGRDPRGGRVPSRATGRRAAWSASSARRSTRCWPPSRPCPDRRPGRPRRAPRGPVPQSERAGAHDPASPAGARPGHLRTHAASVADGTLRVDHAGARATRWARARAAGGRAPASWSRSATATPITRRRSAAFDAGASLVTHLFNAMRPWHHREPGLAGAGLARADVVCELINDGIHLHDAIGEARIRGRRPGRIALVTDAIAATGTGEGESRLGSTGVQVRDGAVAAGRWRHAGGQHAHHGPGAEAGGARARGCR